MTFGTNTSAEDVGWRESRIEQCISQLYIKSVSRTGPRSLWFSSGNQHCRNGYHCWFILLSSIEGIGLAQGFLICTLPYFFFSFPPCKEYLINLSYWWDWKLAACSLSQNWNPQVLRSALPFLVHAPSWHGGAFGPKGLGSYFMVLVWACLLRWVVATRWSNEILASAYWPYKDWPETSPSVLYGQQNIQLGYCNKFLCIAFGSWYFHKLSSVFRCDVPWSIVTGQKMNL